MDKPLSTKPEECRYSFFQHTQCEFFPCHKTAKPEDFNCLFCYCPLYALGDKCGGNFKWGLGGLKDCSESPMWAMASRIAAAVWSPMAGAATATSPRNSRSWRSWPGKRTLSKKHPLTAPSGDVFTFLRLASSHACGTGPDRSAVPRR